VIFRDPASYNGTEISVIEARDISEKVAWIQFGITTVTTISGFTVYLATVIKTASNQNTCAVVSGNVDGVSYQYQATTSGPNCDTTASQDDILSAVLKAVQAMLDTSGQVACFKLSHGGTWTGNLQLAANGVPIVAGRCANAKYQSF